MEYRLPSLEDKEQIIDYIKEHYSYNEKSLSASNGLTGMKYEEWVDNIKKNVNIPNGDWGKSLTYLVFDNKKLVGILSIRYDLSTEYAGYYGHVGYGVRPNERRKGYATKMLEYALEECKKYGLNKVILGCYKDNIGSAKTIIKNGGILIREDLEEIDIDINYSLKLIRQYYEIIL